MASEPESRWAVSACEKCWGDAWGDPDTYRRLLNERADKPCTPEQQAGEFAFVCDHCKRKTIHGITHVCMVCGRKQL